MSTASISGIYSADDGGSYFVRFVGSETGGRIFWFGEHPNGNFSNVLTAEVNVAPGVDVCWLENVRWADVPKGRIGGGGSDLELAIINGQILRSLDAGGFGGSRWIRATGEPRRMGPMLNPGFAGEGLTGIWDGDDGATYYVRQMGNQVFWFGESCALPGEIPAFANVFVGGLAGRNLSGEWADVPYGRNNGTGTLELLVEGNSMSQRAGTGGFSCRNWVRRQVARDTVVSSLSVFIATSTQARADDLRGGSVEYGTVQLTGGRLLPKVNLNNGQSLQPGQFDNSELPLPAGTRLSDLQAFILEHDGAPRNLFDTYDNWDVGVVQINVRLRPNGCAYQYRRVVGQPVRRMTGQTTTMTVGLA